MKNYQLRFEERIPISRLDNMIASRLGLYKHNPKNRIIEQKSVMEKGENYSTIFLIRSYKEDNYINPLYLIKCKIPNNFRINDLKNPSVKNYELVLLNFEFDNLDKILEEIKDDDYSKLEKY